LGRIGSFLRGAGYLLVAGSSSFNGGRIWLGWNFVKFLIEESNGSGIEGMEVGS
jgi:hypothetical protein